MERLENMKWETIENKIREMDLNDPKTGAYVMMVLIDQLSYEELLKTERILSSHRKYALIWIICRGKIRVRKKFFEEENLKLDKN